MEFLNEVLDLNLYKVFYVVAEVEGKSKKPTTVDFSTKNKTATDS